MTIYNREDYRTVLPQLEKQFNGKIEEVNADVGDLVKEVNSLKALLNDVYTVKKSVTFSSGVATITVDGVTTSTRVVVTRCVDSTSSLMITAKATADNTIKASAYNCQNAGSAWSGTTDITFLIDNR